MLTVEKPPEDKPPDLSLLGEFRHLVDILGGKDDEVKQIMAPPPPADGDPK